MRQALNIQGSSLRLIVPALLVIMLLAGSFFVVPPNQMAAIRWMGGTVTTKQPLGTGVHFKVPFLEDVDYLQTSQSTYTLPELSVYTNDNQAVAISISVIYQVPPSAVLHLLYDVGRAGNTDIDATIVPVVRDRALAVFAKYNTLNISDSRTQITAQMKKEIAGALTRLFGINVVDVQLTSIRYSPVFSESVENAVKAKAQAVQAQNTVLQRKYEGEQKTVTAQAEAQAKIEAAKGIAESTVLEATAQAKAIALVGQAMQANPQYTKFYAIQHWNGILPQYMGGNGAVPFVDVGGKGGK
ncbi:MAG: prohibitin family protein [Xanthomonadaceae bacterium]|jgi:regulator of protease activity HflC (stomatin/prohibitin superfamily)|nr:prohibitin family protein [Xanthomonadaceae bacterium]MDE3072416.1 prohibitin family protein [Pseudomonadota bacterium]